MGVRVAILTVIFVLFALAMFQTGIFLPSSHAPAQSLGSHNNIAAAHAWKDGIHQYTGTFLLPHSCFRVKQSGEYKDNHNIISFQVEDVIETEKTCTKIKTRFPFLVIIESPENTPVTFLLNGEEVPSKIRSVAWGSAAGTMIDSDVSMPNIR